MDQWRTPGHRLKLYLLAHGIAIDPAAEHAWRQKYDGPLSLSEYASTSGVCLYTRSGAYVNAPFLEEFTRNSAAVLRHWAGEFVIEFQGQMFSVGVVPVPQYHKLSYRDGDEWYPYTNLGVTHTDRVRISPIEGCAWRCRFCDMGYEKHYRKKPVEELVEVIRLAAKDPLVPARHVLISGGTPHTRDQGWLDDVYEYVAARSPLPVDVMMPARTDPDYHRWLRSVGVQMVSINLEVWDEDRARLVTPNKARQLGRGLYLESIERAVEAFGVGQVQSLLVFGESVESLDGTLQAVRALAERGCIPVLSPFRPDAATPMGNLPPTRCGEMRYALDAAEKICETAGTGVKPGPRCVPCQHNTVSFPDGSDFYLPWAPTTAASCVI